MAKRNMVMKTIRTIFERFGYGAIETPILNPAETILGKYGEEGDRLTYNWDQRDTQIALPYDLTVPFARFVASNRQELPIPFKRYQIQRVWRAEKPQKGRLREFYQCDVDIIGTRSLIAEAEVARVIVEVFKTLGFKNFSIKVNSRRLLNAVLNGFNVPEEKAMQAIRIIDKLEKIGEEAVIEELEKENIKPAQEMLNVLKDKNLEEYDTSEIEEFLEYCTTLGIEKYIDFDPTLARGLDYYTGVTYEVVSSDVDYGTLCAGGRYDDLCGLFCKEDFSGVGVAFGFERIMLALEEMGTLDEIDQGAQALVTLFDENSQKDALQTYEELIKAGIKTEIYFEPARLAKQFKFADKKKIPFVITRGPEEIEKDNVTIKNMTTGKQKTIPRTQLTSYLTNYSS
jgi:histidyl-tRNA synthetase